MEEDETGRSAIGGRVGYRMMESHDETSNPRPGEPKTINGESK